MYYINVIRMTLKSTTAFFISYHSKIIPIAANITPPAANRISTPHPFIAEPPKTMAGVVAVLFPVQVGQPEVKKTVWPLMTTAVPDGDRLTVVPDTVICDPGSTV